MCVWEGTQMHMSAQNVTGLINREKLCDSCNKGLRSHD